jgi:FtsP/CotA-like multicopper oxidase with cupredoxin domain
MSSYKKTRRDAHPKARRGKWKVLLLIVVGLGATGALGARALVRRSHATPADRFLEEFEGSYPLNPRPTATVRTFDIVAAPARVALAGKAATEVWAYNGQVPGPELRVRLGETVRVRFTNHLPQATTIHWHGVRVPNDMDGVPTATRPAIEPGGSFVYEFTPKDAGTFWYHPHHRSSEQVERGLYGVLVVEDATPSPYQQDAVWILDDWLLTPEQQVEPAFNTMHDLAHDGRWGNLITINGRTNTVLALKPGSRIRLRLLNAANGRVFLPDFGALKPNVIAMDGLYSRAPFPLDRPEIAPGNRMDLDITVPSKVALDVPVIDRYWPTAPNPLAVIRVDGEPVATPGFRSPAHAHVPRYEGGMEVPIAAEFLFNARRGGTFGIEWTINGHAFPDHAHVPLALQKWSRVRFTNMSPRIHPIHLHGMFFHVLARNGALLDEPFFRDTVLVHPHEIVDVGVVPLEAGEWMMHCHILEHAEAGMMTMLDVR